MRVRSFILFRKRSDDVADNCKVFSSIDAGSLTLQNIRRRVMRGLILCVGAASIAAE
jgi:hypothetical protein